CHDLELELSQLKQAADTADKRRAAIAEELSALSAEEAVEREARAAIDADLAADRRRLADAMRARNAGEEGRNEAELALAAVRDRVHAAERATQAADTADKRRAAIAEELSALSAEEAVEREARAAIDADLAADRRRLADAMRARNAGEEGRNEAELALAAARDRVHAAERATQEA